MVIRVFQLPAISWSRKKGMWFRNFFIKKLIMKVAMIMVLFQWLMLGLSFASVSLYFAAITLFTKIHQAVTVKNDYEIFLWKILKINGEEKNCITFIRCCGARVIVRVICILTIQCKESYYDLNDDIRS